MLPSHTNRLAHVYEHSSGPYLMMFVGAGGISLINIIASLDLAVLAKAESAVFDKTFRGEGKDILERGR